MVCEMNDARRPMRRRHRVMVALVCAALIAAAGTARAESPSDTPGLACMQRPDSRRSGRTWRSPPSSGMNRHPSGRTRSIRP